MQPKLENYSAEITSKSRLVRAIDGDDGGVMRAVTLLYQNDIVGGNSHVFVGDGQAGGHGGDDVPEQDGFALRRAGVDWRCGGGGGDVIAFVGGEYAEREFGAFS